MSSRLARLFFVANVCLGLAFLGLGFMSGFEPDLISYLWRPSESNIWLGLAIVFLSTLLLFTRSKLTVALSLLLIVLLAIPPIENCGSYIRCEEIITGEFIRDPVVGVYLPAPNSLHRHIKPGSFSVRYTIDAHGDRYIPVPTRTMGDIWVLGCSFTFGYGVEDEECWPYIAATQHWTSYQVRNHSMSGSGTNDVLRRLEELLESGVKPAAVIYGWSTLHYNRNYLRKQWRRHSSHSPPDSTFPHYECLNGKAVFQGMMLASDALLGDSPMLDRKEEELTIALIRAMHDRCESHQIPFIIIEFNCSIPRDTDPVSDFLRTSGWCVIDATNVSDSWLTDDPHPSPEWHQKIAHFVAMSAQLAFLRSPSPP